MNVGPVRSAATRSMAVPREHPKHRMPWLPEEDQRLRELWGTCHLPALVRIFGRREGAIRNRVLLLGLEPLTQGTIGIAEAARRLGFDKGTVKKAADAVFLGKAPRVFAAWYKGTKYKPRTLRYAFEERHLEKLASYLLRWSRVAERCQRCGRTDRPHKARGLCGPCYNPEALRAWRARRVGERNEPHAGAVGG